MKFQVTITLEQLAEYIQENTGVNVDISENGIEITDSGLVVDLELSSKAAAKEPKKIAPVKKKEEPVKAKEEPKKEEKVEEEEEKAPAKKASKPNLFSDAAKEEEPAAPKATKSLFGA